MSHEQGSAPRVAVVVVGDLGRSPRMQAHALALADRGADVDLVGSGGSPVYPEIEAHAKIQIHELQLPRWLDRTPSGGVSYVAVATLKMLSQSLQLLSVLLFGIRRPSVLLVQNPPFLPTLPAAWMAARFRRCRLIVDWHNLGWKVLAQRLGARHPIVRVLGLVERSSGGLADTHFCVSRAMQSRLLEYPRFRTPFVLHDRPADWFEQSNIAGRRDRLRALASRIDMRAMARDDVAVVVCPTSWTADEDFELLLDGILRFDDMLMNQASSGSGPPLRALFLLTGQGELKTRYESRISRLSPMALQVRTAWLPHRDYRCLLASADLGLCLHRSASGIDLPYKVPEMFGAGLPLGVFDYGPVIEECCTPGADCFTFSSAEDLGTELHRLLSGFPHNTEDLDRLRQGVVRAPSWQEAWGRVSAGEFGLPVDQ